MLWSNIDFQYQWLSLRFIAKNSLFSYTLTAVLSFPCFDISCLLLDAKQTYIHIRFVINCEPSRNSQFDCSSSHSKTKRAHTEYLGLFFALSGVTFFKSHVPGLFLLIFHVPSYTWTPLWICPRVLVLYLWLFHCSFHVGLLIMLSQYSAILSL